MKKIVSLLLTIIMIVSMCGVPVYAADNVKVKLCNYIDSNGKWVGEKYIKFDVQPQIINDRTYVPIRAIAEELGYEVYWLDSEKEVRLSVDIGEDDSWTSITQYNDLSWLLHRLYGGEKVTNFTGKMEAWGTGTHCEDLNKMLYDRNGDWMEMEVRLKIGSKVGKSGVDRTYGGKGYECIYFDYIMDSPPKIVNERTLLPLRAVGDMLGLQVSWNDATKTVTLKA